MDFRKFLQNIFCKDLLDEINNLKVQIKNKDVNITQLNDEMLKVEEEKVLQEKKATENINFIDEFCLSNYKVIKPIAYKQKREIRGVKYAVSLQELITPNSYAVIKFKKGIVFSDNILNTAKNVGKKVAQYLTWDSDNNLDKSGDYYLYSNETLARRKGDCEDHAFVVSSIYPKLGVAYGWAKNIGWHAFNVFSYNNELYILDTVENSAYIMSYDKSNYKINYIITEANCYEIDGSVQFGTIAGW